LFYYEQNKSVKENKMSSTETTPVQRGLLNWWQGLILAASSALIGVVAALMILGGSTPKMDAGPTWAIQLLRFVPHFLMLFGILADAFTYEGVYWTGTAVGLFSMVIAPYITGAITALMAAISAQLNKGKAVEAMKGGAEYMGFRLLSPDVVETGTPETLVISASILSYYIFDLVTNLSLLDAAGAVAAAGVLFMGQAFAITGGIDKAALSGGLGVVIGGISYGLISAVAPSYLPSSVIPGSKAASGGGNGGVGPGRRGFGLSAGDPVDPNMPTASGPASARRACPA
jgi:hypothetical protein